VGDAVGGPRGWGRRLAFDAKEKARRREHPFEAALNATLESAFGVAGLEELEQGVDLGIGDRAPVGARGKRRQDPPGARQRAGAAFGTAHEHATTSRGVAGVGRAERASDQYHLDGRIAVVELVRRAAESVL